MKDDYTVPILTGRMDFLNLGVNGLKATSWTCYACEGQQLAVEASPSQPRLHSRDELISMIDIISQNPNNSIDMKSTTKPTTVTHVFSVPGPQNRPHLDTWRAYSCSSPPSRQCSCCPRGSVSGWCRCGFLSGCLYRRSCCRRPTGSIN